MTHKQDLTDALVRIEELNRKNLAEAADWYYHVCELGEDEELDPNNHVEVIQRAFSSSDCDDFAWVLNRITGWPFVVMSWAIPGYGPGHHSMVQAPDGLLLDVYGWGTQDSIMRRYGKRRLPGVTFITAEPCMATDLLEGIDSQYMGLERIMNVLTALPYAPFNTPEFQQSFSKGRIVDDLRDPASAASQPNVKT